MVATTRPSSSIVKSATQGLIASLQHDNPKLSFKPGQAYYWSPAQKQITYKSNDTSQAALFSILHEAGHALLDHKRYHQDFELLQLEVAAWEKARTLANKYSINLDEDHIQDCLDSYRDWLYRRSICPTCNTKTLQQDEQPVYRCFNCHTTWRVAPSRFCRPYRQQASRLR